MALWLRHTDGVTTVSTRVIELGLVETPNVTRKIGTTLRGNTFDHRLSRRRKWTLTISADQTYGSGSSLRAFLEAFFTGGARYIAIDASVTEPATGWIGVAIEGGDLPVSYIEECLLLPEFTFVLIEKEAA